MRNAAGLHAGLAVPTLAAVGDDGYRIDPENVAGRVGGLHQQPHADDRVGDSLLNDHLVLRVDRDLRVLTCGDPCMRSHGGAVGIGQRDLVLAGPVKLSQHRLVNGRASCARLRSSR
jgi:hypothetical protein